MTKNNKIVGLSILLLVFLQACAGAPRNNQPPINSPTELRPTSTPFQPATNTPASTPEDGILPSITSTPGLPPPTNPPDQPSVTPLSATLPSNNPTSMPPTITPDIPIPPAVTSPAPPTPGAPTNTPDIGIAPLPGDPSIAIVPYSINAGGTLQIILEEFGANESVSLDIHMGTQLNNLQNSLVVTVNNNGNLTFDWTVPQNYAVGDYSILATGQTYRKKVPGYFRVR